MRTKALLLGEITRPVAMPVFYLYTEDIEERPMSTQTSPIFDEINFKKVGS